MFARPMLRTTVRRSVPLRRFESTATERATETAKHTASKAAQGLSRVTSAAGSAIAGAAKGLTITLGRAGRRTGRTIAFIEKQVPWVIYYSKVGAELSKLVFKGQHMSPPSMATFLSYYQSLWTSLKQPSSILNKVVNAPQNIDVAQMAAGGVLFVECLGFFTVGEMLGRFKLVGYHGKVDHGH